MTFRLLASSCSWLFGSLFSLHHGIALERSWGDFIMCVNVHGNRAAAICNTCNCATNTLLIISVWVVAGVQIDGESQFV